MPRRSGAATRAALILALLAAPLAAPSPAAAQTSMGMFGAWEVSCYLEATPRMCAVRQERTAAPTPGLPPFNFIVLVLRPADRSTLLRVFAPLGVMLRPGVEIAFDGTVAGRIPFETCLPGESCLTETVLDPALLDRFAAAREFTLTAFVTRDQWITLAFPAEGLAAALHQLDTLGGSPGASDVPAPLAPAEGVRPPLPPIGLPPLPPAP